MNRSKRVSSITFATLSVLFASVILLSGPVSAQEQPRPLNENRQIIQQHSQELEKKTDVLLDTTKEIQTLEQNKQELSQKLEIETKTIGELKQKLEEKRIAAEAEKKRLEEIKNMFVHVTLYASNSAGNTYAPGNCTWGVKSWRPDIPNNWGNANTWYQNAQSQGWNVGSTPKKGAIATTTAGWAGHVAYVTGVSLDGQYATIKEMNYGGLYNINVRTVYYTEFNYIYELE